MAETRQGAFRIAHVWGISVFVHWSWLLVAYFEISYRGKTYQSPVWNLIEYLSLFAIVLLHEFGHSLACRQVGGVANQIMLWPLGGVAFVSPPPRPGATLWTIAAGPLVNVALVPVTVGAVFAALAAWPAAQGSDLLHYLATIAYMNAGLLLFNLLPIYPLDGGQILQSILWFLVGRVWSLRIVSVLGMVVGLMVGVLCLLGSEVWLFVMSAFVVWRSFVGWQQARALSRALDAPRHTQFACPACGASPPTGTFWHCAKCRTRFDTFAEGGTCPGCGGRFNVAQCPACNARHPIEQWVRPEPPGAPPGILPDVVTRYDTGNPFASPRDPL